MGQVQSETAYYQPNPDASLPFAPSAELLDPQFSSLCNNGTGQCSGWGLRILDSQDIGVYGAGLYSFFSNYNNCMNMFLLSFMFLKEQTELILKQHVRSHTKKIARRVSSVLKVARRRTSASTT